jgi:hypothetical protein
VTNIVSEPAVVSASELASFAPAVPAQSPKSFNRFEIKYLVHHAVVPEIVRGLQGYCTPDRNGHGEWGYRVSSIYWDSPDLRCFWEKVEGVSFRRKLRVRKYGHAGDVFIEIKQRIDRTLQKRRVLYPLERAMALLQSGMEASSAAPESDRTASEIWCFVRTQALRPTMAISYRRRAFFGIYARDLRVTFDTRVQYSPSQLDIRAPFESGKYVIDPRLVVMEVKFSDRVPHWLCALLNTYDLQVTRLSKYCTAVDKEYYQGQMTPLL